MRGAARRADSGAALAWGRLAVGGPVGGGPLGAGLVAEGGDGGFDGGEEVVRVDGAGDLTACRPGSLLNTDITPGLDREPASHHPRWVKLRRQEAGADDRRQACPRP